MHPTKGHVTRSLADGYARSSLLHVSDRVATVTERTRKMIARYSTLPTRKAKSRKLLNLIYKQLAPISLASIATEGPNGTLMLAVLLPGIKDKQMHLFGMVLSLSQMGTVAVDSKHVATITAHALGRVWQRTAIEDLQWDRVRVTLGFPLMYLWPTIRATNHHHMQRLALPCYDGLLVGKMEHGAALLTTYLAPPMSSKWQEVREVYDTVLEGTSAWAAQSPEHAMQVTAMYKGAAVGLNIPGVAEVTADLAVQLGHSKFNWMKLIYQGEESDGTNH